MPSSRSATVSTRLPPPARRPSSIPADRCAIRNRSTPPTSTGWRWYSPAAATSATDLVQPHRCALPLRLRQEAQGGRAARGVEQPVASRITEAAIDRQVRHAVRPQRRDRRGIRKQHYTLVELVIRLGDEAAVAVDQRQPVPG